ncbi:MAG TPA: hypothetical protein P5132_09450, partial [Bacteroidales bacterium]|nr:hypothetical protein [Bacteroidales bacterium]
MDTNTENNLKNLRIIHIALMLGVMFFLLVSVFINQQTGALAFEKDSPEADIFLVVSNIIALAAITGGAFVFRNRLKGIDSLNLQDKLLKYREAHIIRAATIESPTFFFLVCFILFGSSIFIIEAICCFAILGFLFPSTSRIA